MNEASQMIVGVSGGTASGKTTFANAVAEGIGTRDVVLIGQDCYYRDQSHIAPEQRAAINYDHPDVFDNELFGIHLNSLREGKEIDRPVYSFQEHVRLSQTVRVKPASVIIVEGLLILWNERLRELFDLKIFLDVEADLRFIRRLSRDVQQRGRTVESVISQYLNAVRPMHERFVEPCRAFADIIVTEGGMNHETVNMVVERICASLHAAKD